MNTNFENYKTFYFVAKYGNITAAAEALYSEQPNVTRAIKNLERDLGCVLFTRSNKGVTLTPEGENYIGEFLSHMNRSPPQRKNFRVITVSKREF